MAAVDVVFRVWDDGATYNTSPVFALMPHEAGSTADRTACNSYGYGGHSAANYQGCIDNSRPATEEEYGPLLREMQGMGYEVRVIQRASRGKQPGAE